MNEANISAMPQESSTSLEPAIPKHNMHWIFLGPNGQRAGWAILLFAAIFVATDSLMFWAFHSALHRMAQAAGLVPGQNGALPPGFGLLQEFVQASGMFVATFAMSRIERRPALAYGFQGNARVVRFLSGLVLGFAAISAFVGVLWKAGYLSLDGQMLRGAAIWKYGLVWGIGFLLVGIFEESLFRGYLQYTLTRGLGFWWGAILVSLLFGFGHGNNPGETPIGLFSVLAIGLVLCLSLWYTGSLWWAVGFHAAWDWGESYFYGTSDSGMIAKGHLFAEHPVGKLLWSGGTTGPEGSILVLPLLAIFALLMWLWWGRRGDSPFKGAAWRPRAF